MSRSGRPQQQRSNHRELTIDISEHVKKHMNNQRRRLAQQYADDKRRLERQHAEKIYRLRREFQELNQINEEQLTAEYNEKVEDLERDLQEKHSLCIRLTSEKEALETDKYHLTSEKEALETDKYHLTSEKEALETDKYHLTSEKNQLSKKLKTLRFELQICNKRSQMVDKKLLKQTEEREKIEVRFQQSEKTVVDVKTDNEKLAADLEMCRKQLGDISKMKLQLEDENKQIAHQLQELQCRLSSESSEFGSHSNFDVRESSSHALSNAAAGNSSCKCGKICISCTSAIVEDLENNILNKVKAQFQECRTSTFNEKFQRSSQDSQNHEIQVNSETTQTPSEPDNKLQAANNVSGNAENPDDVKRSQKCLERQARTDQNHQQPDRGSREMDERIKLAMENKDKLIQKRNLYLSQEVHTKTTPELVIFLHSNDIFNEQEYDMITSHQTSLLQMQEILRLLRCKDKHAFKMFLVALNECGYRHIFNEIMKDELCNAEPNRRNKHSDRRQSRRYLSGPCNPTLPVTEHKQRSPSCETPKNSSPESDFEIGNSQDPPLQSEANNMTVKTESVSEAEAEMSKMTSSQHLLSRQRSSENAKPQQQQSDVRCFDESLPQVLNAGCSRRKLPRNTRGKAAKQLPVPPSEFTPKDNACSRSPSVRTRSPLTNSQSYPQTSRQSRSDIVSQTFRAPRQLPTLSDSHTPTATDVRRPNVNNSSGTRLTPCRDERKIKAQTLERSKSLESSRHITRLKFHDDGNSYEINFEGGPWNEISYSPTTQPRVANECRTMRPHVDDTGGFQRTSSFVYKQVSTPLRQSDSRGAQLLQNADSSHSSTYQSPERNRVRRTASQGRYIVTAVSDSRGKVYHP